MVPCPIWIRGGTPPDADSVVEKYVPKYPCGKVVVFKVSDAAAAMVRVYDLSKVLPVPSVARTVKLNVPNSLGIPDSAPLEPKFCPLGIVPAIREKLYAGLPPVAEMLLLYGPPCCPEGRVAVVI